VHEGRVVFDGVVRVEETGSSELVVEDLLRESGLDNVRSVCRERNKKRRVRSDRVQNWRKGERE
jgi:hypothetical protein